MGVSCGNIVSTIVDNATDVRPPASDQLPVFALCAHFLPLNSAMRLAVLSILVLPSQLFAQVTTADYERAAQFLPTKVDKLFTNDRVTPRWIAGSDRFWYYIRTPQGPRFKLADPAKRTVADAFDHARLATALKTASDSAVRADSLPFQSVVWSPRMDSL